MIKIVKSSSKNGVSKSKVVKSYAEATRLAATKLPWKVGVTTIEWITGSAKTVKFAVLYVNGKRTSHCSYKDYLGIRDN